MKCTQIHVQIMRFSGFNFTILKLSPQLHVTQESVVARQMLCENVVPRYAIWCYRVKKLTPFCIEKSKVKGYFNVLAAF